jgi:hypothetical protein
MECHPPPLPAAFESKVWFGARLSPEIDPAIRAIATETILAVLDLVFRFS